ncbi:MAG: type II toxin-antitoxin system RelE/ParE family toxin [Candidatus Harrisonbacteria bacterium CG10_big_fil_rev_8_21_14_0_10_42_17]|uniref:Type II toxin-antitoxin system RelE/ParE family toxin n=1 Tax=Candidatus Harrisonbacteria bacterium CG10_big_fil_rev_8_21_14_0_10_42_17 TaxID=1974584 RepID=A0A2M6WI51_9BACT|nr:MAG: type II toxin-antitoxin system RelE/ParE family toxin [Candidatus Harrisonbacteria bacterium CG10_big_fil_rev_8_21_14_0_10_42_17]
MEIEFRIQYHSKVISDDIPKLPPVWKRKIKKAIEEKLTVKPEVFGKPLRKSLKGYRKLRVGDYRVIFRIEKRTVKIFVIQHRKEIYLSIQKRN